MTSIHKSNYFELIVHPEIKTFEARFFKDAEKLLDEKFRVEYTLLTRLLDENQTKDDPFSNLLVNTLAGGPIMEPVMQKHMHEIVYPKFWEVGIRTKAYCLGEEIISRMSVELTVQQAPEAKFQDRFFGSLEEAKEWLASLN